MTIEIPQTIELLPAVLAILGLIFMRLGDGPSIFILLSLGCFIAAAILMIL